MGRYSAPFLLEEPMEKKKVKERKRTKAPKVSAAFRKISQDMKAGYPDYRKMFIYLSPEGAEASDPNNWCSMGYEDELNIVENARRRTKPLPDAQLLILCNIFPSNFDRFPLNIRKKEPHFAIFASFCFISCKVAFILTKGVDRCLSACYTYAYVVLYIIYYFGAAGGNRDRRASSRQETG